MGTETGNGLRFVTYTLGEGSRVGALGDGDDAVVDLQALLQDGGDRKADMLTLIADSERILPALTCPDSKVLRNCARHPLSRVRLLAPIPRPPNIFCVGLNYKQHATEFQGPESAPPDYPIIFGKSVNAVAGPNEDIPLPSVVSTQIDYEGELAVVIGRKGRDILAEAAASYVFGYTCLNDVTARDLQKRHGQWLIGKSLDKFCPMGPSLVPRAALDWPPRLRLTTRVNGEVRQQGNTGELIFDISTLIVTLSASHTLEPGDIIATGTPAGVGMGFDPPRFLKAGDSVEVDIEGLSVLRNTFR